MVTLVVDGGLEAVSVRQVAAKVGVTGGMVQHHFPTKQAMLRAAMATVTQGVRARVREARAGLPPAEALREISRLLVPLDAERSREARVWLAFAARAAVDPELAAYHQDTWTELENTLAGLFAAVRQDTAPEAADRTYAALLLAMLDGLAATGLIEPRRLAPERMEMLLDRQIDVLLAALRQGTRPGEGTPSDGHP
ncbi:TetR/AcrR family transcriptional regulator [Actinophytocola xanthii]|uniref:TetR/AcrR family transcriptional regulator n=1 Tax=Actinophytocola xanthii TaxID=1912961 RepID=UPI00130171F9|nr:TetR/AcrR family transcriptional regulator [Actinophytocola xanthii]